LNYTFTCDEKVKKKTIFN